MRKEISNGRTNLIDAHDNGSKMKHFSTEVLVVIELLCSVVSVVDEQLSIESFQKKKKRRFIQHYK